MGESSTVAMAEAFEARCCTVNFINPQYQDIFVENYGMMERIVLNKSGLLNAQLNSGKPPRTNKTGINKAFDSGRHSLSKQADVYSKYAEEHLLCIEVKFASVKI